MNPAEARREFLREFRGLCSNKWNAWEVWSDWLILASSAIYNAIHQDPQVEAEYMRTIGKYSKDEANAMARLLGIVTEALEAETHDFLGAVFHELEMHNKQIGQFFTPFHLCKLMAQLMRPDLPKPGRLLHVGEPAAGSGSMILAFHEVLMQAGAEQSRIFYHLKDLDHRAFRMSYIQVSLCGLAAEVELGDTLRGTTDRIWRTPGYYLHDMPTRMRIDTMLRAIQGDQDASALPEAIPADDPKWGTLDCAPPPNDDQGGIRPDPEPPDFLANPPFLADPPMDPGPFPVDVIMPPPGAQLSFF